MDARSGRAARREFGVVVVVALLGIVLTMVVAFAPWYELAVAPAPDAVPAAVPIGAVLDGSAAAPALRVASAYGH